MVLQSLPVPLTLWAFLIRSVLAGRRETVRTTSSNCTAYPSLFNTDGLDTCQLTSALAQLCNNTTSFQFIDGQFEGPVLPQDLPCQCNSPFYQVVSACSVFCWNGSFGSFQNWTSLCPSLIIDIGLFPVSPHPDIPEWAFLDLTADGYFNETQAILGPSTQMNTASSPSPSSAIFTMSTFISPSTSTPTMIFATSLPTPSANLLPTVALPQPSFTLNASKSATSVAVPSSNSDAASSSPSSNQTTMMVVISSGAALTVAILVAVIVRFFRRHKLRPQTNSSRVNLLEDGVLLPPYPMDSLPLGRSSIAVGGTIATVVLQPDTTPRPIPLEALQKETPSTRQDKSTLTIPASLLPASSPPPPSYKSRVDRGSRFEFWRDAPPVPPLPSRNPR